MIVWLKVTQDELELPVAVADSAVELAKICNTTPNTIYASLSHVKSGRFKNTPYRKVKIEED